MSNNYNNNNFKNNNQRQHVQSQQKEELHVDFKPTEFRSTVSSQLIQTVALSKIINEVFRNIFDDFIGSLLVPTNTGSVTPILYFKPSYQMKPDGVYATQPKGITTTDVVSKFNSIYEVKKDKFEFTDDFFSVMGRFFRNDLLDRNSRKPIPKKIKHSELIENANYQAMGTQYVVIATEPLAIDIYKLLSAIYGWKDENGDTYEYLISICRNITQNNYLLNLSRISTKEVEKVSREVGLVQQIGLPIVRD